MEVAIRAITLASAMLSIAACSTNATAGSPVGQGSGSERVLATVGPPAPVAAPGYPTPAPDADGNPACPVSDSWGKAPTDNGIFVTYWSGETDYVTALVRTSIGTDFARSASIDPIHEPLIFDFPDIDPAVVKEVLITTNVRRCFATPDLATTAR